MWFKLTQIELAAYSNIITSLPEFFTPEGDKLSGTALRAVVNAYYTLLLYAPVKVMKLLTNFIDEIMHENTIDRRLKTACALINAIRKEHGYKKLDKKVLTSLLRRDNYNNK